MIILVGMKENIIIDDDILSNNEKMFYFSESNLIPDNTKEDFKMKQNFLFVFVNPKSGSHQGANVLEYAEKYKIKSINKYKVISFPIKDEFHNKESNDSSDYSLDANNESSRAKFSPLVEFSTIIFSILDKEDSARGTIFIKKYLSDFPKNKIKILIAGGDGTVLRVVEDLNKVKIPIDRCIFGAMPFGTGNDLSHSLGFGNECKVDDIKNFQRVLYTYLIGTPSKIDIWELDIVVNKEEGGIYDVITNGETIKNDENGEKMTDFKKTFANYFSLGFDARVGYQFEQRRTSSRFCNKLIYGIEAAKRILCCKKNYGLTQLLDSFLEGEDDDEKLFIKENPSLKSDDSTLNDFSDIEEVKSKSNGDKKESLIDKRKLIFKTKNGEDNIKNDIVLKGNPVTIICQNIDFYMGGTQNIWDKSSHMGITKPEVNKEQYQEYKKQVFDHFQRQVYDDKIIEFFTYENGIELGLERVAPGLARRVYQGRGPVYLEFKKHPDNTEKKALGKVFLNCDGEFYRLQNPVEISVRLNTNICKGQINILKNEIGF